jgi:hypothetical protein
MLEPQKQMAMGKASFLKFDCVNSGYCFPKYAHPRQILNKRVKRHFEDAIRQIEPIFNYLTWKQLPRYLWPILVARHSYEQIRSSSVTNNRKSVYVTF